MKRALLVLLVSCRPLEPPRTPVPALPPVASAPVTPAETPEPAAPSQDLPAPSPVAAAPAPPATTVTAPGAGDEVWLRGSTHVHAKPSGDSSEPVESVIRWYEKAGYDFIVLTDHNRVSEVSGSTLGQRAVHDPSQGLIVLAGIELTHNRKDCEPPGDESRNCRIHVNGIGVTARPEGKLEWTDYSQRQRVELYEKAFATARDLGASIIQINHPNYYWGMTLDVFVQIAKSAQLVEVANSQFTKWNVGNETFPSTEAEWDAALAQGLQVWGVATDDAHHYDGGGKYPAGGGWVVVKARRDPDAILAALAGGRFYASTGVTLSRAERIGDELVVEIAPGATQQHSIAFIENGKTVATTSGPNAKRALPQTGYVRAVVTRDDGKQAWVQPVRR